MMSNTYPHGMSRRDVLREGLSLASVVGFACAATSAWRNRHKIDDLDGAIHRRRVASGNECRSLSAQICGMTTEDLAACSGTLSTSMQRAPWADGSLQPKDSVVHRRNTAAWI